MNKLCEQLASGVIHLYQCKISRAKPEMVKLLRENEREVYQQLRHHRRKQEFLASRFLQNSILEYYLKEKPFIKRERGKKPKLEKSDLCFSVSHSHDLIVLAISKGLEVGVDIEYIKERKLHENFKAKYFSKNEQEKIKDLKSFYQEWTRKEAYLKSVGTGISVRLGELDTYQLENFYFYPLELEQNYVGHLVSGRDVLVSYRKHNT